MKPAPTILLFALSGGAACTAGKDTTAIANPAATYCVEQGGAYTLSSGDSAGTCSLEDGRVVDAWEYYRANAPDVA